MIKIGLIGLGTVGSGVYEIIETRKKYIHSLTNQEVEIKKILEKNINKERSFDVDKSLLTDDAEAFINDEEIDIVVEAITNTEAAYKLILGALNNGKHVVTASKAVISKYFKELLTAAEENNVGLFFEAAVAGGVPIIKPMLQTLSTNDIIDIKAILNGTTNFILSKMYTDNSSFADALQLAKELGYAEADPTDDIEGYDSLRKLTILSSLAYKSRVLESEIPCRGITSLSAADMENFKELNLIAKLIGSSKVEDNTISASVEPVLFSEDSVFNTVQLSNNIVSVTGSNVGELKFFGQGAGKLPTANSIVSDIIDIINNVPSTKFEEEHDYTFVQDEKLHGKYYVRFTLGHINSNDILSYFDEANIEYAIINRTDNLSLITKELYAPEIRALMEKIGIKNSTYIRIESDKINAKFRTNTKPILVQKYGGTSLGSIEKIKRVAKRIIQAKNDGYQVVTVVSAMGKTTDELVSMAKEISDNPSKREMDMLLATGEQKSISLLAMAIREEKEKCISLTGRQSGIVTDGEHSDAKIIKINTDRLLNELESDNIVIVAGFQGSSDNSDITTLGRGGSDTTAVAIAAALNAEKCEIYTDVNGVYSADPRKIKDAKLWDSISYDEMLEFAFLGAKVLHPRSVELAKKYSIPLIVKNSHNNHPGTRITEVDMIEKVLVRGITTDTEIAKVSILEVPDKPGIAYHLFDKLAKASVVVDIIIQAVSRDNINDISFTVNEADLEKTLEIVKEYAKECGSGAVTFDRDVAKLSVVGIGMAGSYEVASTFFKALYETDINIQMISTSEIKISCIIANNNLDEALQNVHEHFQLGEEINK